MTASGLDAAESRVATFVGQLKPINKAQYELIRSNLDGRGAFGRTIPNNDSLVVLPARRNLAQGLQNLEQSHLRLNSFNRSMASLWRRELERKNSDQSSLFLQQMLGFVDQWQRHAALGNHYLGPRFAGLLRRSHAEFTGQEQCFDAEFVTQLANDVGEQVLGIWKINFTFSRDYIGNAFELLSSQEFGSQIDEVLDRLEFKQFASEPDRSVTVSIFLDLGSHSTVDRTLHELQLSLLKLKLEQVGVSNFQKFKGSIGFSQGYTGLKELLLSVNLLNEFYDSASEYAFRQGFNLSSA